MIKSILYKFFPNFFTIKVNSIKEEFYTAGHYYSVIPSLEDIKTRENDIFNNIDKLENINCDFNGQKNILKEYKYLHNEKEFELKKIARFNIENDSFSYDDAPILHYFLRKNKPKRIIEVGCGNSSALMMDTNEFYLDHAIQEMTFIDLSLKNLKLNIKEADIDRVTLIEQAVQEVDLGIFTQLEKGDLLFIDSSHVSKIGSDLNHIIFKILPILKEGVFIHFHDVRYPFEYSKALIYNKVFWNESYLLRAFLMYNNNYKVHFWLNGLLNTFNGEQDTFSFLPLDGWDLRFNKNTGDYSGAGGSIYLQKLNK